jgi:GAF domain-containing protein
MSKLTWKKIFQLVILLSVILLAWSIFDNREYLYTSLNGPMLPQFSSSNQKLSKHVTDQINAAVMRSELIVGIQVTLVDFQRNVRIIAYTSIDNPQLKELYNRYSSSAIAEVPLFDDDEKNNKRLVNLINGDFVCNTFKETIVAKLVPEGEKYVHTICANGIPPRYSKFAGIIGVYLSREPTPEEVDQIRTLARQLSSEIYDHDLR